ncbi:helix-turn-helix transcriptional regulator [Sinanaerobacter sp. ZZT-01]|uniref:helix-turn-helix domain-containing protein n=1 Tax=Sinanaerobacter sp. ZZT-01 TaxID=3111540 RepID=UPI002D7A2B6A|nr:helix-turn-helix transcriptional regulator [Sinanaerobacter sp. ZZT-01]WRR93351.1 helix-turn-helix transcriptional regulator [Sinanaerobacter sp. ZZT-01]
MEFSSRLKSLRNEKELTQQQLSSAIQISRSTIAGYEKKNKQPDYEKLCCLADFFDVSIDYLLGRSDIRNFNKAKSETPILTPEQQMLLKLYNSLNELNKGAALERIKVLLESQEDKLKQEQATELGIYKKNA